MSGAFGWGGRDRRRARDLGGGSGFKGAKKAYKSPPPRPSTTPPASPSTGGQVPGRNPSIANVTPPQKRMRVNPKDRTLACTASNVLILFLDGTGSMGSWRSEIWARVKLLYEEARSYLGDDLQILFGTFGDLKYGDRMEVADFGAGPELDDHLTSLSIRYGGGGDEEESPEIPAYYLLMNVDVSKAKHVYAFFIIDEKGAPTVSDRLCREHLGISVNPELEKTADVFRSLLLKMETFIVLRRARMSNYDPNRIRQFWVDTIGEERVVPLDDGRRVVDICLAVVAKTTGQMADFTSNFKQRNQGSRFLNDNLDTVQGSILMVPDGQPQPPDIQDKPSRLLDALKKDSTT